MKPRQRLIARCKELGCMLIDDGSYLWVDPPTGMTIKATGLHGASLNTRGWKRDDAYREILHNLEMGIEPCDDPEHCETCLEGLTWDNLQSIYRGERLA